MIILLITLFAVALTITIAGLLLSPKKQAFDYHEVSFSRRGQLTQRATSFEKQRSSYRRTSPATREVRRAGVNRHMRTRRSPMELQRRFWTNVLASLNVGSLFGPRAGEQTPWLGIILILVSLFTFGAYSLATLLPNSALIIASSFSNIATQGNTAAMGASSPPDFYAGLSGASKALVRIGQLDPAQYASAQEYDTWAYSACSAASMTEIINAYGHHYRLTDILKVEAGLGAITADQGLMEPSGIDRTVVHFGFNTLWLHNPSVDDVINVANRGRPVIISFPPDRWSGGHILVVIGGNSNYVYLADSSRINMQAMPRKTFLKYWAGFAVLVTPIQG